MLNRQKLERENKNHTSHITIHTSQNGITLIALIITIIVMLILVGVTINVALNGGLFTKASEASKQMQVEADRETLLSAVVAAIGYDGKVVLEDLELPTGWTGSNGTYTSPKGNTYSVDENGKIVEGERQEEPEKPEEPEIPQFYGVAYTYSGTTYYFLENNYVVITQGERKVAGRYSKDGNAVALFGTEMILSEDYSSFSTQGLTFLKNENDIYQYSPTYDSNNNIYLNAIYSSENTNIDVLMTTNEVIYLNTDDNCSFANMASEGMVITKEGKEITYDGNVYTLVEQ